MFVAVSNDFPVERSLQDILWSVSDVLFPADIGKREVFLDSRDSSGDTPLHVMLWRNDLPAVGVLVDAGANVNAVGDMGETPMHVAVSKLNASAIKLLLGAGADPHVRSEFGDTAYEQAKEIGGAMAAAFAEGNA